MTLFSLLFGRKSLSTLFLCLCINYRQAADLVSLLLINIGLSSGKYSNILFYKTFREPHFNYHPFCKPSDPLLPWTKNKMHPSQLTHSNVLSKLSKSEQPQKKTFYPRSVELKIICMYACVSTSSPKHHTK